MPQQPPANSLTQNDATSLYGRPSLMRPVKHKAALPRPTSPPRCRAALEMPSEVAPKRVRDRATGRPIVSKSRRCVKKKKCLLRKSGSERPWPAPADFPICAHKF